MKSTKLKTVLLGLSCFAVATTFAQDTPKTPKPDTTQLPKSDTTRHDSTSVKLNSMPANSVSSNVKRISSFFTENENIVVLKKEAENEILTKKSFANVSA